METGVELFMRSCWKHEKYHSEEVGQRTWLSFLQAWLEGGVSSSLQHNWPVPTQGQRGKVTGRTVALSNRKKTLHADAHHKREDICPEGAATKHILAGPGYGQNGDLEFYRHPINITMLAISRPFLVGTREGPMECSPSEGLSIHITRFYAHICPDARHTCFTKATTNAKSIEVHATIHS